MEWSEVFKKIKEKHDFSTLEEVLDDKYKNGRVFPPKGRNLHCIQADII